MKFLGLKLTLNDFIEALPTVITVSFLMYYRNIKIVNLLASFAIGSMAIMFFHTNVLFANTICALSLLLITYYVPEGFMSSTPASISATVKKLKGEFENNNEHFMNKDDDEEGYSSLKNEEEEGFMNMNSVFKNISTAGYTSPGFGIGAPLVEGFEDTKPKPETKSKPAPVAKKEEMAMPFKLGEIPSQVKNGPHIDASSTLMKAIHSLNPEQISAMTKDTKQLIETQKSLMGMLGTMKPMMNDGKELMETFQEMFGKQ
jgi:hypothetical protein